ncbi:MAG: zinc ribbon domain-containing protein [Bacillota bacterium]|nr:zinc ribbon domain-containing protein [Bacillota bacterium]
MSLLNDVREKISDTARAAVKASRELAEISRLNAAVKSEEEKIKTLLQDIGLAVFETYRDNKPVMVDLELKCKEIMECRQNIVELKERILDVKNLVACPNCKASVERVFVYCPECGTQLESSEQ